MTSNSRPDQNNTAGGHQRQHQQPAFSALIYCGYDYPPDGIGNHLGLIDRLIFSGSNPIVHKSLHELPAPYPWSNPYDGVEQFAHLQNSGDYERCLYMDVSRDMWNEAALEYQIQLAKDFKQAYHAVTCIYLMWESDTLTPKVRELIEAFDFCIVTSTILSTYLADHDIDYVYLKHPYEFALGRTGDSATPDKPDVLCFGVSAGLWRRKNIPLIAQGFLSAFAGRTDVKLKIHTRFDTSDPVMREEYRQVAAYIESDNIELTTCPFSREEYLDWFRSIDVYCFVSSGEGYSVTPREALHLGIPVILLDAHVHTDFSHLPGIIRVRSSGQVKAEPNVPGLDSDIGKHWQVDPDSLHRAFVEMSTNLRHFRSELRNEYQSVLDYHDINRIRDSWLETITRKFIQHDKPTPAAIAVTASRPRIDFRVGDTLCRHSTGIVANEKLFCFDGGHKPGYCLFSECVRFECAGALTVEFNFEIIRVYAPLETLVTLDAYDSVSRRTIARRRVTPDQYQCEKGGTEYQLKLPSAQQYDLQFRLFWHGGCDLLVAGISVYPSARPAA